MPCAEHTLCLLIQQIITVCRRHEGDDGLVPAQHLAEGTAPLSHQVPPPRRMESRGGKEEWGRGGGVEMAEGLAEGQALPGAGPGSQPRQRGARSRESPRRPSVDSARRAEDWGLHLNAAVSL